MRLGIIRLWCMDIKFLPSGRPVLLARDARFFQPVKAVELFYLFSFTQQPIFLDRLNSTDYYFIFRVFSLIFV